jgi:hypothetical protein
VYCSCFVGDFEYVVLCIYAGTLSSYLRIESCSTDVSTRNVRELLEIVQETFRRIIGEKIFSILRLNKFRII